MTKPSFSARILLLWVLFCLSFSAGAQQFKPEISAYLQSVKSVWRLTDQDVAQWSVSSQHSSRTSGTTYTYLNQEVNGIRIFNAVSTAAIRNGEVVYYANRFHSDAAAHVNSLVPVVLPSSAVKLAAASIGAPILGSPVLLSANEKQHQFIYTDCGIANQDIKVELVLAPSEGALKLAWNVNMALRGSDDWWNVRIDALSGEYLDQNNWTVSCQLEAGYLQHNGDATAGATFPESAFLAPLSPDTAYYNVFQLPAEAPSFGPRVLLANPNSPISSPFGWQDTNGAAGAEYTITRGNNVYAYEDRNNTDVPGYSPDGGVDLNFDFPLDLGQSPQSNQDAIITNLFYVNNIVHDILFLHGFDEAAGNFQASNYSGVGQGDDYVLAEAQDGGGTNNANFATPDDGQNGRMQMYLFPNTSPSVLTVHTPGDIAGDYTAVQAGFGPGLAVPVTADLVLVDDGVAPNSDACEPIVNGAALAGKIAVIDRGTCTFASKVEAAEAQGAIAVVMVNNAPGAPIPMGGNSNTAIVSVMISQADGDLIKAKLNAGETVNVTLGSSGTASADLDGSLDNGIVAHEYGHGVSNRLTGGPSNSNCLFNGEQGGEGWSDWLALIFTIEAGDAGTDVRGIGTYAFNDASGAGIRRYPYSTDMAVNPQTYADLALSSEVHNVGEIWCDVLWDMTWNLIDAEGFDPDWFNGTGGNITALNLVLEGMKMQPCGPGFLDGRDAILAADEALYGSAHRCMIWEAFARRGMGADANQGSADVAGDETAGFALPTICQVVLQAPTANFSVNNLTSCFGEFKFTDASTDVPQAWLWDFGDGATSTAVNPSHSYSATGTYTVTLTVTNTLGSDSQSIEVSYATTPAPGVGGNTNICSGSSAILTATVDAGNTAQWSTGGNVVYTGTTFITPALSNSTTYSVRQLEDKPLGHVGPLDNTFGGGGNHNTGFDGRLLFEAYAPMRIVSVLVYAQGAGNRTISLYNASNALVQSVTVNVPSGASRITLNLDVPVAGLYSLSNVSENLYRNNGGANYPYTYGNLVRIYASNATTNALAFYYYFYDWEVQETVCTSDAAEVTVNVLPGLSANFGFFSNNLTANFGDATTGNPTSWTWNFGDGSPLVTLQNPVHVYNAPGIYTVTLTVTDGNCTSIYQQTISIAGGSSSTSDLADSWGMRVFPNPASGMSFVHFDGVLHGPVDLSILDASGRKVYEQHHAQCPDKISFDAATLPAGVYDVRVNCQDGSGVRKLVVVK